MAGAGPGPGRRARRARESADPEREEPRELRRGGAARREQKAGRERRQTMRPAARFCLSHMRPLEFPSPPPPPPPGARGGRGPRREEAGAARRPRAHRARAATAPATPARPAQDGSDRWPRTFPPGAVPEGSGIDSRLLARAAPPPGPQAQSGRWMPAGRPRSRVKGRHCCHGDAVTNSPQPPRHPGTSGCGTRPGGAHDLRSGDHVSRCGWCIASQGLWPSLNWRVTYSAVWEHRGLSFLHLPICDKGLDPKILNPDLNHVAIRAGN
uniref:atherin-like n=1 Tax=Macaca mulatta TaxID=9544 RepID=UPI0010A295B7|nr:atherin-like [Macaca mulatta]